MGLINAVVGPVFEAVLFPFRTLPAWVALAVLSLVTAIGVLIVYKKISNQAAIDRVKSRIYACFYEIRLFNDDLRAVIRAQAEIMRYNAVYIGLNLVPLLVMIVPFVLIVAQLQSHYGWDGVRPGEPVLLTAKLTKGWAPSTSKPDVALTVPEGLRVETPSVWVPSQRELTWRISAQKEGDYELTLRAGDASVTKEVFVAGAKGPRAPVREQAGFVHQLLYPAEDTLPADSPVHSIRIDYPDRSIDVLGWNVRSLAGIPAWMIVYFVLAMVFALAFKRRFGVTF